MQLHGLLSCPAFIEICVGFSAELSYPYRGNCFHRLFTIFSNLFNAANFNISRFHGLSSRPAYVGVYVGFSRCSYYMYRGNCYHRLFNTFGNYLTRQNVKL